MEFSFWKAETESEQVNQGVRKFYIMINAKKKIKTQCVIMPFGLGA